MSKFNLFVVGYSIVMVILFFTFCFLMTTINPPQLKVDLRRFREDDIIYSDEFLPNDNVAYGLEKVQNYYEDSIDAFAITNQNSRSNPTIYSDKKNKTNCARKEIIKMVTRSMKHVKGMRRSINKENQQDVIPRSVHLKIKDLNGRPKIEIKVVQEKSKKMKTHRSSANITNNTQHFYNNNPMTDYVYDNISKAVIVVIENNETLVLDFARDSINLYDDNNLGNVDDFIRNDDKNTNLLNKNISETNTTNTNFFNTSIEENMFKKIMMNRSESNQTDIEKTTQKIISGKNEVNSSEVLYNSVNCTDNKTKQNFKTNSTKDSNITTKSYTRSEDKKIDEIISIVIPVNTLGLLVPEATATLPFNYHFINK